jgi:hypothetical protein
MTGPSNSNLFFLFRIVPGSACSRKGVRPFRPAIDQLRSVSPLQPGCPHWQATSVVPFTDSQWALQNLSSPDGTQLQTGFPHFFWSLMVLSSKEIKLHQWDARFSQDEKVALAHADASTSGPLTAPVADDCGIWPPG